jgi:zinc transporter ZupT
MGSLLILTGVANLFGGGCSLWFAKSERHLAFARALGAGLLIGSALLIMAPGALKASTYGGPAIFGGFCAALIVRQIGILLNKDRREEAWVALAGNSLHSFFEGAMLGAVVPGSHQLGMVAAWALFIHKLPEGFGLSAVVLAGTGSRAQALAAPLVASLATVAGVLAGGLWGQAALASQAILTGVAAGAFLCIGATSMLPATSGRGWLQVWVVLLGGLLIHASTLL